MDPEGKAERDVWKDVFLVRHCDKNPYLNNKYSRHKLIHTYIKTQLTNQTHTKTRQNNNLEIMILITITETSFKKYSI